MFDPYHKWLGIPPEHRPPTHYQLLHLSPSEKDAEVIEEAAIRQTTHLRSYQLGPQADLCTKLLNEVALARKTLLTPALREKYDADLARKSGPHAASTTFAVVGATAAEAAGEAVREGAPAKRQAKPPAKPSSTGDRSRNGSRDHSPRIARPAPNLLPLWIGLGGGAAVLLILVMVAALFFVKGGDANDPKKPVIVVDRKPKDVINPVVFPVKDGGKDGAKDGAKELGGRNVLPNPARGRVIDLIALFNPADIQHGKWLVENGKLECPDMHFVPRTHFPYKPPAEYDYTVTFSQKAPRNGISLLMPNGPGNCFYWNVARMQADGVYWTLASSLDGNNNLFAKFFSFRIGEPCKATIEVRKTGVRCFIDGKFVGEHKDFATMKVDVWRQMRNPAVLGLACDDPTTFHEVKVIEVGEPGEINAVKDAKDPVKGAAKDPAKDPVKDPVKKNPVINPANGNKGRTLDLIALFDPADVVHGKWHVENGQLECATGNSVPRTHFPYRPPAEYDYTVRFVQQNTRNGVSLIMPNGQGSSFFWNPGIVNAAGTFWKLSANKEMGKLDTFRAGVPCTTTVEVRKAGIRCLVDGKLMIEDRDPAALKSDVWRRMRDASVLALGCDDPTRFLEVRVTEIGEPGVLTREQK